MKKNLYILVIIMALVLFASGCKTKENNGASTIDTPSSSDIPATPDEEKIVLSPIKYTAKQKVNVYFFWGKGCPHCYEAEILFNQIKEEYGDCFKLVAFETWNDKTNSAVLTSLFKKFNIADNLRGVPFIGVGDFHQTGYDNSMAQDILGEITNACSDPNYVDEIGPLINIK